MSLRKRASTLSTALLCLAATLHAPAFAGTKPPAAHLSHEALMSLAPSPDVRPTLDASGNYVSGGIGVLVYDGVNAMDALGPYQVFSTAGLRPMLISASRDLATGEYKKTIRTNSGISLTAHRTIADTPNLEVFVATGGAIETALMARDTDLLSWIKSINGGTVWTSSVCTGSWILGATGLLQGKKATSNWYMADDLLAYFGAIPLSKKRYIFDGKIVTAAGVTAGIDMALAMIKTLYKNDLNDGRDFTQAVMLDLQYDPNPPISGGSPAKTDPYVYEGMQMMYDMVGPMFFGTPTFGDYVKTTPILP